LGRSTMIREVEGWSWTGKGRHVCYEQKLY
jgi:hypothetical protein